MNAATTARKRRREASRRRNPIIHVDGPAPGKVATTPFLRAAKRSAACMDVSGSLRIYQHACRGPTPGSASSVQSLPEKYRVLCPPGTQPFRGLFFAAGGVAGRNAGNGDCPPWLTQKSGQPPEMRLMSLIGRIGPMGPIRPISVFGGNRTHRAGTAPGGGGKKRCGASRTAAMQSSPERYKG